MSDLKAQILEQVESYAAPFAGDSMSGSDVSYEVNFERVKTEIDKLTAMSGGQPQWRDVVEIADDILRSKSKDFRLLSWSAIGRFNTDGVDGFVRGLAIMLRVGTVHWDTLFPPARRAKARANLFDWMNEQALNLLQSVEPTVGNGDAIRTVQGLYDELDGLLAEKLGDAYSGLGGMRSLLREKVRAIPEDVTVTPVVESAPVSTPAQTASVPSVDSATATSSGGAPAAIEVPSVAGVEDVLPALRAHGKGIVECARHLRKADPANSWAYRLHRIGLWLAVKGPPPAEGKLTRLPAPGVDVRKKLEARAASEQWSDLLGAAEDLSGQNLFWLDLHRYVALAMDRLGALFVDARATVGSEVVGFVQKFPTVLTLSYNDGTPFAEPATQMWLEQELSKHAKGGGTTTSSSLSAEDEEVSQRFAEAKELVAAGKVADGLRLANQLAARAADTRMRFRGRMTVGELALQGSKPEVGRPILEQLVSEIESRQLEEWEPAICANVLSTLIATYRALGVDSGNDDVRRLCDRLCRLDPAAALRWTGS